jgi:hypothetical protein
MHTVARKASKPFKLPPLNFAGIGVVYVMLFLPRFWVVKVGYTGTTKGVKKRASSVSKAAPGIAIPVGAMIVPFAWNIEQGLLDLLSPLRWDFYKGQGHTETFVFPAHVVVIIVWFGMWLDFEVFRFCAAVMAGY